MDTALASIVVATIGTVGTIIVAILHKLMKTNANDHLNVKSMLDVVHGDIKRVDEHLGHVNGHVRRIEEKIDNHIEWHLDEK